MTFLRRASAFLFCLVLLGCAKGVADPGVEPSEKSGTPDAGATLDAGAPEDSGPLPERCEPLDDCDGECVDLTSDPSHCGGCGTVCDLPYAEAGCEEGACVVASCELNRYDDDGDPENGCEVEDTCRPGAVCTTECGSQGSTVCDGREATCAPPDELCNLVDDDCDGACDDGALLGCRSGIHRFHSDGAGHRFSRQTAPVAPYELETSNDFWMYGTAKAGLVAIHQCQLAGGNFRLATQAECVAEPGATLLGVEGYWALEETCGSVPLYGLYQPATDFHFHTLSAAERDNAVENLGYEDRGVAGYVWDAP